jgi:SET domain-containing protein
MALDLRKSAIHGTGVFTTDCISKHSVISKVNVVREITEEHPLDPDKDELFHHCHWYPDGTTVLVGKPHCYLNHSCEPNTFFHTVNKVTYLISMRDIQEDDELTLEYSLCNFRGQVWECKCGSLNCLGRHRCGFSNMTRSRQMQYLPYLDPFIVEAKAELMEEILNKMLSN